MKKDGIGKLHCRICAYKYQKRLGPLDKQVDIYCAMIDEAEALNSKKRNENIGFVSRADDNDGEDGGVDGADIVDNRGEAAASSLNDNDILNDVLKRNKVTVNNHEEEKDSSINNQYSASQKIAEMGLGGKSSGHAAAEQK